MTVHAILESKGNKIVAVSPDESLADAARCLSKRRIGAVLVMKEGRLEGILSERDVVRVIGERGAAALDEPVRSVMTRKVMTCRRNETVSTIMERMTTGKFRHLPVVENDKVVGIISIGDVVNSRVREYEAEQEAILDYIKTA
jgi:CBS domain-containing protein